MGFRFRKSINLGKIFRINISKSGVGTSVGVPGYRVSHGPRGKRTTASIPGTGVSFVKEERKPSAPPRSQASSTANKKTCGLIALITTAIVVLCGIGATIIAALDGSQPQPTEDINQAVTNIYSTMTMEAAVKERYIELTNFAPTQAPAQEQTPIPTLAPIQANTLAPSQTPLPTNTFVPQLPTQPPAPAPSNPGSSTCNCSTNYNCSDFATHSAAQACFISCGGSTAYNWSGLDRDRNGLACESLP